MRWCRYLNGDGGAYGIVEGEFITEVEGSPFSGYAVTARSRPLNTAKLLAPVIPGNFYCGGANYPRHIQEMSAALGRPMVTPSSPPIGYRSNSALIGTGDDIIKPRDAGADFQYEGELVAVIGKSLRRASRAEAQDGILGWTIGNDVSERGWQKSDLTQWRAKNADTFKPMGPWIDTDADPKDMRTIIRLNGREVENFATGDMLFDAADFICEITRYITLHPGDVVWLGTDGLPQNMSPGDVIEIEITGIGVLRNRIVQET